MGGGFKFTSCPWSYLTDDIWILLEWYTNYVGPLRKLPFGGSDLQEHPLWIVEAFEICDKTVRTIQNEAEKKGRKSGSKADRDQRRMDFLKRKGLIRGK